MSKSQCQINSKIPNPRDLDYLVLTDQLLLSSETSALAHQKKGGQAGKQAGRSLCKKVATLWEAMNFSG